MVNYIYDAAGTVSIVTTAVTGTATTWTAQGAAANDLFGTFRAGQPDETLPIQWSTISSVTDTTHIVLAASHAGPTTAGSKYLISSPCETASEYSNMADAIVSYALAQASRVAGDDGEDAKHVAAFEGKVADLLKYMNEYDPRGARGAAGAPESA